MADQDMSDRFQDIDQGGPILDDHDKTFVRENGGVTKLGMAVTHVGETLPDAAPAITTDRFALGIAAQLADLKAVLDADPDWNIDTVLPDNTEYEVYKVKSGKIVPVILEATAGPVAIVKGEKLALGTEAGKLRKHLYVDATEATDTLSEVLGSAEESHAGHATEDKIILMRLD